MTVQQRPAVDCGPLLSSLPSVAQKGMAGEPQSLTCSGESPSKPEPGDFAHRSTAGVSPANQSHSSDSCGFNFQSQTVEEKGRFQLGFPSPLPLLGSSRGLVPSSPEGHLLVTVSTQYPGETKDDGGSKPYAPVPLLFTQPTLTHSDLAPFARPLPSSDLPHYQKKSDSKQIQKLLTVQLHP